VGFAVRTAIGRAIGERLERSFFKRIPGYALLRILTQRLAGASVETTWQPALVEIEDALVPGFIIETLDDGRDTVFVPSVPTPLAGAVYVLAGDRVLRPQDGQELLDVRGWAGLELAALAGDRVVEGQPPGVESLPREVAAGGAVARIREGAPLAPRVDRIADDGVADVGHVDPDLVGAAGYRAALDEGGPGEAFDDPVEGAGLPPARDHRHLLALRRVASDRPLDDAAPSCRKAKTDCEVALLDLAPPEGDRQSEVGALRLRHHHQPGRVLVEPVHDPGALDAADRGQILAVAEEGVDQGPGGVARRRVDDEAGRLVEDQELRVFVEDDERNVLGEEVELLRRRLVDLDAIADRDLGSGLARLAVEQDMAVVDEAADAGARPLAVEVGDAAVEANPCEAVVHGEAVEGAHCLRRRAIRTCSAVPSPSMARAMSWLVESAPESTKPRAASPRVHSSRNLPLP
jgi:hypothetical protein